MRETRVQCCPRAWQYWHPGIRRPGKWIRSRSRSQWNIAASTPWATGLLRALTANGNVPASACWRNGYRAGGTMTSAVPRARPRLAPPLPAHPPGRPRRPSSLEFAHPFRGKSQNGFAGTPPRRCARGTISSPPQQRRPPFLLWSGWPLLMPATWRATSWPHPKPSSPRR